MQDYSFGIYTITFYNRNMSDTPFVWVLANKEIYAESLAKLLKLPHIEVVQSGVSLTKGFE